MPRRPRMIVGLLAAMVVATAGCTLPAVAPNGFDGAAPETGRGNAPAAPGGSASWRPCPEIPREVAGRAAAGMTYECASVAVPQDWNEPATGETYEIAMIRIRSASQRARIGSLLLNPGGPGASGIETAVLLSFGATPGRLSTAVTDRFDIVGFDPRGVGRSAPLKCISGADQDAAFAAPPDPVSDADFTAVAALNRKIATGCAQKYPDELDRFSTEQAARDLDALRSAVGDRKLTYLGFSYGTLLGATYAQLYPTHVRAMVLDGAVDPTMPYVEASETQAKGFERAFTNFAAWCGQTPARCPIAPDARKAVTDAIAGADARAVKGRDGRTATSGWIFLAVVSSLYSETGWEALAAAVAGLRSGNPAGIFALADRYAERRPDGSYSNLFDANLAVNCADTKDAPSVADVRRLQGEWRRRYPLFGAALAVGMLPCTFWAGDRDPYPAGPATSAPPIVVVGTTGDPATPYENTADLAKMLGVGHVLTWEGEGHTAYPGTPCIVRAVDDYLIDLTVPREGLRCPAR